MKPNRQIAAQIALIVTTVLAGCVVDIHRPAEEQPPEGTERGPCLPNNSCNDGLICRSGLCVDPLSPLPRDGVVLVDVGQRDAGGSTDATSPTTDGPQSGSDANGGCGTGCRPGHRPARCQRTCKRYRWCLRSESKDSRPCNLALRVPASRPSPCVCKWRHPHQQLSPSPSGLDSSSCRDLDS